MSHVPMTLSCEGEVRGAMKRLQRNKVAGSNEHPSALFKDDCCDHTTINVGLVIKRFASMLRLLDRDLQFQKRKTVWNNRRRVILIPVLSRSFASILRRPTLSRYTDTHSLTFIPSSKSRFRYNKVTSFWTCSWFRMYLKNMWAYYGRCIHTSGNVRVYRKLGRTFNTTSGVRRLRYHPLQFCQWWYRLSNKGLNDILHDQVLQNGNGGLFTTV